MAIREALLALLERGPASAYQLKKDFDRTIGLTWPLNMGQVSTTLQRLNRDGLIEETAPTTSGSNDVGTAAAAPLWRLTNSGAQELDRWWRSPITPEQRGRDELVMKLAVAVEIPGLDVSELIQHQRHALQQLLHDITRLRRQTPPTELATRLVLDHHIFITEAELRWLDTVDGTQLRAQLAQHPVSVPLTASSAALTATIQ